MLPVMLMELTVSVALPVFVSVTIFAVFAPIFTGSKLRLVGESDAPACELPVPVRATVCGLPAELSATLKVAERLPVAAGVKTTEMVQFFPAATLEPQVFVWLKSPGLAPVKLMLVTVSAALPLLVSVTTCAVDGLPTAVVVNVMLVGASETNGAVVPVPVSAAVCGLPDALSATVIVPV